MDTPKYDGTIHPNEWIDDFKKKLKKTDFFDSLKIAKSLVDSTIKLPARVESLEDLGNALKEDISFTIFKTTNKKTLELLKYVPEREGGKTSKFISDFRKLCYNAEINDIEEQKKYFYQSLPVDGYYNYFFAAVLSLFAGAATAFLASCCVFI